MANKDQEGSVLVGFGKHDLIQMMEWIGTEDEERLLYAPTKYSWPPRYRRTSICSEEEIQAFIKYNHWVLDKLKGNI